MKATISELIDGELEPGEAGRPLDALRSAGEARDAWRSYHLIGDAMRDTRMVSSGFSVRVAARLAGEPTVIAPARRAPVARRQRLRYLSAAASVAAVALVGWVAFGLQENSVQVANAPVQSAPAAKAQAPAMTAQVPPPSSANDYIYAHQGLSPRISLQGAAPYVRMVSSDASVKNR